MPPPVVLNAALVARAHTTLAYAAFTTALVVGCAAHYKKIVKNGVAGYPHEWFPSVSAACGDWYPERNLFQILIALTAPPRVALVALQYYLHHVSQPRIAAALLTSGVVRTLACGGWVYITSSDDHDVHDVCMILYILTNIPWMAAGVLSAPKSSPLRRKRITLASVFFTTLIPLIYFFVRHKVHRIPGAYTHYALCEWGLILLDVGYDALAELEFADARLQATFSTPSSLAQPTGSTQPEKQAPTPPDSHESLVSILKKSDAEPTSPTPHSTAPRIHMLPQLFRRFHASRPTISFLADTYLAYIHWSVLTALVPTLFFFSVSHLGLAGTELSLFALLSPALLAIPVLARWARNTGGQTTLRLLGLIGVLVAAVESPGGRLLGVALGAGASVLGEAARWGACQGDQAHWEGIVLGCGMLLASLAKMNNYSNNPVWPFVNRKDTLYNKIGLGLALLAVYEAHTRHSGENDSASGISRTRASSNRSTPTKTAANRHWLFTSLPFGALLFTIHNLLGDGSTLVAWSWTGYENSVPRGPVPHIHGALTLIAQCLGLALPVLLSTSKSQSYSKPLSLLAHPAFFAPGALAMYAVYTYRGWTGYVPGLGLAAWLMALLPSVLAHTAAAAENAPTVFLGAYAVYCVFTVVSLLTVAYAFVPGGQVFRERTDV
ncbi:hypothetical protein H0H81_004631 [Sphagnurus paluster]|uniref:Uncharacterized protein n=1 Tax=Sphagnurus paluster TaxID=117069 RepID=A0A9P7K5T7_9AGAR|nr:hypothetical protein H0H81_004631 [Sphagnurus paluster]